MELRRIKQNWNNIYVSFVQRNMSFYERIWVDISNEIR